MQGFTGFSYGALVGVWIAAALVEVLDRKGRSWHGPVRLLMALVASVAFISYVISGR